MTRQRVTLFSSKGSEQRRQLRAMADYLGITDAHLALRVTFRPGYYDEVLAEMQAELDRLEKFEIVAARALAELRWATWTGRGGE